MSTTYDLKIALKYSASYSAVLLRLRTSNFLMRGADITYLSAFPGERECELSSSIKGLVQAHGVCLQ